MRAEVLKGERANRLRGLLRDLKAIHSEYGTLLLNTFPPWHPQKDAGLGDQRLCELSNRARAHLRALGQKIHGRLCTRGFYEFYPFDNAIDHWRWRNSVREGMGPVARFSTLFVKLTAELDAIEAELEVGVLTGNEAEPISQAGKVESVTADADEDSCTGGQSRSPDVNTCASKRPIEVLSHDSLSRWANIATIGQAAFSLGETVRRAMTIVRGALGL